MRKQQEIVWKIIYLLEWTSDYFKKHNIESPRLKSELLLADVLDCTRLELYRDYNKPLTKPELAKFKTYIKRAIKHEPVQMIIGKTPFVNSEIIINSSSIVPRAETEQLVAMVIEKNKNRKNLKILDIGTGSGCIAISIAKSFPDSKVLAIDYDERALELTLKNIRHNKADNIEVEKINILSELPSGKFDIIISNPPYIPLSEYKELSPEVKNWEPAEALTDMENGLKFYKRFSAVFPELLADSGKFYLEIGWNQADKMYRIFENVKFDIEITDDFNNIPRYIVGRLKS